MTGSTRGEMVAQWLEGVSRKTSEYQQTAEGEQQVVQEGSEHRSDVPSRSI